MPAKNKANAVKIAQAVPIAIGTAKKIEKISPLLLHRHCEGEACGNPTFD
jgi:hypothetical protein